ncbi:hypothetical protein, conserved [Eimeria brunetti]|uniref:Transmembrane protein n=1 Tax=Eimeria brunetti TaxID=51314 RepID=U6LF64_9EIME|nr:hypothetical protein, conserved [Eimeria brunetti]
MATEGMRRNCTLFAFFIAGTLGKIDDCIKQTDPANVTERKACLKKYSLFLVHPLVRESISAASPQDYNDAENWLSSLTFSSGPPEEFTFPGGTPLGQAFAKLNWSLIGTADNQHIAAVNYLKRSVRVQRGVGSRLKRAWRRIRGRSSPKTETMKPNAESMLTEGYQLFLSMPPHPDPVAIRLLTSMLVEGLSCPADGSFGKPEKVMVGGKVKTAKAAQLIEAVIYIFVRELFDASDCADPGNPDAQTRMTCRLLFAYDAYMQAGGPMQVERKTEESLLELSPESGESSPPDEQVPAAAEGEAELKDEGEQALGLEAGETTGIQPSAAPSNLSSEPEEENRLPESPGGTEEGPPEPSLELPAELNLEEESGRRERIRVYTQNATASAVAAARLSLKSGTTTLRIVRLCVRSSFFVRYASELLLFFLGKEIVSKHGLFLLLGRRREGKQLLGTYVRALVELSSGDASLGNLSAAAAGIAADEEKRLIAAEQQTAPSFLQGWLRPTAVERTLQVAGMPTSRQAAVVLALSVNVTADVLLAFLLVAISTAFPPAVFAVAVILAVLLIIRSAIISYTIAVPETLTEKVERKGKGLLEKVSNIVK